MNDKPAPDLTWRMEQARQLMELGHVREALVLIMDALGRELYHLRDILMTIREELAQPQDKTPDGDAPAEPSQPEFDWLPGPKSRLH